MSSRLMSRRAFIAGTASAALATLAAACQPKVVEKEVPVTQVVEKQVTQVVEKVVTPTPAPKPPMELIGFDWPAGSAMPDADALIPTELGKKFNVKFNMWWLEYQSYVQQVTTRFAGGQFCDYGPLNQAAWFDQGLVGQISLSEAATYMPKYFASMAKYDNGSLACMAGGMYNGVRYTYGIYVPDQIWPFANGWRKDGLDQINMPVPEKIEDVEKVLQTWKDKGTYKYPVRPRLADSAGSAFQDVFGTFGAFPGSWMEDPAGAVNGWVHPGYREGMKVLREWWKKGLIDPESMTTVSKDMTSAWCQGANGYMVNTTWYRLLPGGEHYDCIEGAANKVAMGPPIKSATGKFGYGGWGKGRASFYVMKQTKKNPEKFAKLMEIAEALGSDPALATFATYGQDGVHNYRAENGALYRKADKDLPIPLAKLGQSPMRTVTDAPDPAIKISWLPKNFPDVLKLTGGGNVKFYSDLGGLIDSTPCKQFTELAKIQTSWYLDFISGKKDPDKDWDEYVNTWLKQGGQCMTDQARKAVTNYDSLMKVIRQEVKGLVG